MVPGRARDDSWWWGGDEQAPPPPCYAPLTGETGRLPTLATGNLSPPYSPRSTQSGWLTRLAVAWRRPVAPSTTSMALTVS